MTKQKNIPIVHPGVKKNDTYQYSRVYLSNSHLTDAAYFARRAGEIEQNEDTGGGLISPYGAYTMGSVLSAVCFLESAINEIYSDAADDSAPKEILRRIGTGYAREMSDTFRGLMKGLWNTEKFRKGARTLEKFQVALKLAEQEEFKTGKKPYQDVALLIQFRNALVHFKPESYHEGHSEPDKLMVSLRGQFPLNSFGLEEPNKPNFVSDYLGYGSSLWAIKTSLAFTDEFFLRLGLKPGYAGDYIKVITDYASMKPLEEIAAKYGVKIDRIVAV